MTPYQYAYPRPAYTADCVVLRDPPPDSVGRSNSAALGSSRRLQVLLIQRRQEPFAHQWALPGGFVDAGETSAAAAVRELREETGLAPEGAAQLVGVFDRPGRDPRGWTVAVAYRFRLPTGVECLARPGDDAAAADWFAVDELPLPLAFDHQQIIQAALDQLETAAHS
jgi:8-oxo-dGTP diphosphatase